MTQNVNEQTEFVNLYIKTIKEKLDSAMSDIIMGEVKMKMMETKIKSLMEENDALKKSVEKQVKKTSTKSD